MKLSRRSFLILASSGVMLSSLVPTGVGHKKVLILGDSIALGFFPYLKISTPSVYISQPVNDDGRPINSGSTKKGIENLSNWLGTTNWDLVYFNFGLHDMKHVKSETGKASKNHLDPVNVSLNIYETNLKLIVSILRERSKVIVFGTTTPVPEKLKGGPYRNSQSPELYNRVASEVMSDNGIKICDLYTYVVENPEFQLDFNVHFSKKGYQFLAKNVRDCILENLK